MQPEFCLGSFDVTIPAACCFCCLLSPSSIISIVSYFYRLLSLLSLLSPSSLVSIVSRPHRLSSIASPMCIASTVPPCSASLDHERQLKKKSRNTRLIASCQHAFTGAVERACYRTSTSLRSYRDFLVNPAPKSPADTETVEYVKSSAICRRGNADSDPAPSAGVPMLARSFVT